MLGAEVHRIVPDLAIRYVFAILGCLIHVLRFIFVYGVPEPLIHRDKLCALIIAGGPSAFFRCSISLGFHPLSC